MADTSPAQNRNNTPFFGTIGFTSIFAFNPPPNSPAGPVIEQELGVNLGGRFEPKLKKPRNFRFQIEPRFLNVGIRFPGRFDQANFFSFTSGLWFRFSLKQDRVNLVPWIQAGVVRRNFTVEELLPEGPQPTPQECEDATNDNPFGGDCTEDPPPLVPTEVDRYRTGVDFIVGFSGSVQTLKRRKLQDMLVFNFALWNRMQKVPDQAVSLRDSLRLFVGFSTGFHPKVARFLSLGFMVGPEFNPVNGQWTAFFQPALRGNFDVTPRGL